jgi:hypothetical protein
MPAMRTSAQLFACVERVEQRRQIVDDTFELHFDAMHEAVAFRAIPFEAVDDTFGARAFDHEAARFGFGALRRVTQVWRHQEHRAFFKLDAIALASIDDVQKCVAFELPKIFFEWIVVKIGALIWAADDGDDEIGVLPNLSIADGWFQQRGVLFKPIGKVNGWQHELGQSDAV